MGQFSWMFADKNNKQALNEGCPAYVALPDGGYIYEPCYDGYGNFGGKDIYNLVADWNREYLSKHPEHDVKSHDMYGREIAFPVCRHSWYWKYADLKLTPEEVVKQADLCDYRGIGIDIACYDKQNAALPFPIKICREKPRPGDYEKLPPSEADPNQGWGKPDDDDEYGESEDGQVKLWNIGDVMKYVDLSMEAFTDDLVPVILGKEGDFSITYDADENGLNFSWEWNDLKREKRIEIERGESAEQFKNKVDAYLFAMLIMLANL